MGTPFMASLCGRDSIYFVEEYLWFIHGEQLKELQTANIGERILSDTFHFKIPDHGTVSFIIYFRQRFGGGQYMFIGIEWQRMPFAMDGQWSVSVNELGYSFNNRTFVGQRLRTSLETFDHNLIDTVDAMTVHVVIRLNKSVSS